MHLTETHVSHETFFRGFVFTVEKHSILLPDGRPAEREVVRHPGGVGIVPLLGDDVILVRQYRYASQTTLLEIPAGKLEPGEDPRAAGLRELAEETGYRAGSCDALGYIIPTGGYCTEKIHLFVARDLSPGDTNFDDGEFVETVQIPFADALQMVLRNELKDAKTAYALLKLDALRRF